MKTKCDQALHLLRQSTGDPQAAFRPGQLEAIEHLLERRGAVPFPSDPWPGSLREMGAAAAQKNLPPLETPDLFALHEPPADYRNSQREAAPVPPRKRKH